jgi:hypothetical protein
VKYLFYLGHPAHFHLFKNVIKKLSENEHRVSIIIKKKDVLENLLSEEGYEYYNIYPKERGNSKISIALSLIRRDFEVLKIAYSQKPDLMIGTSSEITHAGLLTGIKSIVVNEDDADIVPFFSKLSYPFALNILAPSSCSVGKWEEKTIFYDGYHELAYLHPNQLSKNKLFTPDPSKGKIFLLRFAKLTAHHDEGKSGIDDNFALKLIKKLKTSGEVYISSERNLSVNLESYRLSIKPSEMLDFMTQVDLYIGDSQTMAAEAAVLGTPSLRFNDFVGKLGYLEELEHKYGLTYGIKTSEPQKLLDKIDELLAIPNLKEEWQRRRQKMLADKIDVTAFMVWFIENYPDSVKVMKENPDYQYRFK